jgi:protein gp37
MIFVNSMSDLFHKEVPKEFIGRVFDTMQKAHWHTFQVLTKRSSLMRNFLRSRYGRSAGPAHIWCGVSVEDGTKLSRVRHLQEAPAGVRFLSIEPLIGPIGKLDLDGIDWVIVGGESGPKARPMEATWVRSIRDQCNRTRVAFFFKQWGGLRPKTNGRDLDGREWNDFPKPVYKPVELDCTEVRPLLFPGYCFVFIAACCALVAGYAGADHGRRRSGPGLRRRHCRAPRARA